MGSAQVMGFTLMKNFDRPYTARSIPEFWRRWHISLSTWFRDYLYIPLGGNRVSPWRNYLNLVIVFFLCGLWHGASWTFVIWGLYHGVFLIIERPVVSRWFERQPRFLSHVYTLFVVMIGWVFFRSETIADAIAYLRALIIPGGRNAPAETIAAIHLTADVQLAILAGVVGSIPWMRYFGERLDSMSLTGGARTGIETAVN